jgi:hypothetical protein
MLSYLQIKYEWKGREPMLKAYDFKGIAARDYTFLMRGRGRGTVTLYRIIRL